MKDNVNVNGSRALSLDLSVIIGCDDQLRFLRLRHVIERSGLSKSAIYRGIAAGKFPAPIALKL